MSHASPNEKFIVDESITRLPLQEDPHSSLTLVCAACRAGPFSNEGFRQAVSEAAYHNEAEGYCYTTTWGQISQSISDEACSWCTIVRRTRDGLPAGKFPPPGQESVEVRLQVSTGMWKGVGICIDGYKAATYRIYANADDSAVKEIGTNDRGFPKGSYVDYSIALECIKDCSSNHIHCPANEETYLPTRVIDCSDPAKPRLFETHRQIRDRYCTLSYVWGGEQHQKLTTSNIDTYVHDGIKVPLPQTIADAILVTNKLGVRYLWVDALCIIQNSSEDKDRELGIMAHIYRNAYLSISVLSAFRADQGFLPDERTPDVLPFCFADRSIPPGRMILEYNIPHQTRGRRKYETVIMYKPLNERGWCLQESALSPRKLMFQPPHVSYKCRSFAEQDISPPSTLRLGGIYPKQSPQPVNDHILFPNTSDHNDSGVPSEVDDEEIRVRWQRMLRSYSECKITVPSDKLVALASIAEVFQSLFKDQYIAGLWRRTLIDDLLWEVWPPMGPGESHLPRPLQYRAPTWSWASIDGKLGASSPPPAHAASYEAEILACEVIPRISTLPFGEVTDARLSMRVKIHPLMRDGRKCSFIVHKGTQSGNRFVRRSTGWSWTPPLGNCLEPVSISVDGMSDEEQQEQRVSGTKFDCLEGTEQDHEMDFHVIILRAGRQWKNQGDWMQGLLVLRVDNEIEQYRRVAKLDLQYRFQWPDWFDAMPLSTVTLV